MARLLPSQRAALAPKGLEEVAVADGRRDRPHAALGHQPVEGAVRRLGDDDERHAQVEREHREHGVPVDLVGVAVHRDQPVAVAVERDAEVEVAVPDERGQRGEVGGATADVDVRPVGPVADRGHVGAEPLECGGRQPGHGPVGRVAGDPQAVEGRAEALDEHVDVALAEPVGAHGLPGGCRGRFVGEERLDLELLLVGQLDALAREDLDAVVLGRVVARRDDRATRLREERNRRRREDATEGYGRSAGREPGRERLLERGPGLARVAADEHGTALAPTGERDAEARDELVGQRVADDPPDAVGPEVGTRRRHAETLEDLVRGSGHVPFGRVRLASSSPGGPPVSGSPADSVRRECARVGHGFVPKVCRIVPDGRATQGTSASSTAAPCGPCAGRPSCARRSERRA